MKRAFRISGFTVASILALFVAANAAPPFSLSRPVEQKLNWQTNLQTAHKVAVSQNKPLLLVFGADWCHYCKKLEKETLSSEEVANYVNEGFVPIHLDADKDERVAEILQVSSLPCTIVLSPNADLLGRIDGFYTAKPFNQQLELAKRRYQYVQQTSASN